MSCVLVVDDDPDIRGLLEAVLVAEGYRVCTASDGLEALESLACEVPSVLLLDLNMPRLDGLAFADELERIRLRPAVSIIVLSAGARIRRSCQQIRAEGCLPKPFDLSTLLDQVATLAA